MANYISLEIGNHTWHFSAATNPQGEVAISQLGKNASSTWEPIQLQVGEEAETIVELLDRQAKTIFTVGEEGNLKKIHTAFEYGKRFSYWKNLGANRAAVQKRVTKAMEVFDQAIAGLGELGSEKGAVVKAFLTNHFFAAKNGSLARMHTDVFDRSSIKNPKGIRHYLAPEIAQAKEELKQAMKKVCKLQDIKEKRAALKVADYAVRNAEACFSTKLGIPLTSLSGGTGGARTRPLLNGRRAVVVKPGDEGPYGVNTPSFWSWIKQWFSSGRQCLRWNSEPRAEETASRVDEVFRFDTVPMTRTEEIRSEQFNKFARKECSQQVFASGAEPLGEYLGISGWRAFPRSLRCCLADYLARRAGEEQANYPNVTSWWQRAIRYLFSKLVSTDKPLPNLNPMILERAALSKYLGGDIDTHFDNLLVLKIPQEAREHPFLNALFAGTATEDEINTFVDEGKDYEYLLYRLFESRDGFAIINHDGGASSPHSHPPRFGLFDPYLSTRFRYLFEVHPEFEKPFTSETIEFLKGKDEVMLRSLLEAAIRELIGVIGVDTTIFVDFWKERENRALFKKSVLTGNQNDLIEVARKLTLLKFRNTKFSGYQFYYYNKQFLSDIERMHGMIKTRSDHYRFLIHHINETPQAARRNLFLHLDEQDFDDSEIKKASSVQRYDRKIEFTSTNVVPAQSITIPQSPTYEWLRKHIIEFVGELTDV
ncbi:MAG: hypothetical protein S4CHLAM45_10690 [Chlamydiales bacterium]|nr:hypothetical protein [Chlamydiales bacterium]MCH9619562.1 hypothetical protein [Chlamydiales bacterium]MCH9623168.1 hypothetical protein [Chlamydiales bacterium]